MTPDCYVDDLIDLLGDDEITRRQALRIERARIRRLKRDTRTGLQDHRPGYDLGCDWRE